MILSGTRCLGMKAQTASPSRLNITVFDVGQGNCTLVGDPNKTVLPLLIDCGSNSFEGYRGKKEKEKKIEQIMKMLEQYSSSENKFTIVVSHPDKDHYNWLIDPCKNNEPPLRPAIIYLGGEEKHYSGKMVNFLDKLKKCGTKLIFLTEKGSTTAIRIIDKTDNNDISLQILPALQINNVQKESNSGSLVIRAQCRDKSCLIMGDATKKTVEHIIKSLKKESLKADILLTSHHGAEAEGCNSDVLIKAVQPHCIVFSSGFHGTYLHPRASVIARYIRHCERKPEKNIASYRPVYYGLGADENKLGDTYAVLANGYCITVTNFNVYGTLSQGNLTFSLIKNDVIPPQLEKFESLKDCILNEFIRQSNSEQDLIQKNSITEGFFLAKLQVVNFSGLGIDAREIANPDYKLISQIFDLFIENGNLLKELYLNYNRLAHENIVDQLKVLLENRSWIAIFQIEHNGLNERMVKIFEDVWANRGLKVKDQVPTCSMHLFCNLHMLKILSKEY